MTAKKKVHYVQDNRKICYIHFHFLNNKGECESCLTKDTKDQTHGHLYDDLTDEGDEYDY